MLISGASGVRGFRIQYRQAEEGVMQPPDKELALGILDALDDRSASSIRSIGYGQAMARERVWVAQKCGMIDAISAWLERQKPQARHDVPLQQAITTLCDRLAVARDALVQDMADMDAVPQRAWSASQRGGDPTPGRAASGARKVRQ